MRFVSRLSHVVRGLFSGVMIGTGLMVAATVAVVLLLLLAAAVLLNGVEFLARILGLGG